jgi:hypothetical protein
MRFKRPLTIVSSLILSGLGGSSSDTILPRTNTQQTTELQTTELPTLELPITEIQTKKLLATQAGVAFTNINKYSLIKAPYHLGQPDANIFEEGEGNPNFFTKGITSCAGIELRTPLSYSLIHGMGLSNVETLLSAVVNQHHQHSVPLENIKIKIKTDCQREEYQREVQDYLDSNNLTAEIEQVGYGRLPNKLRSYDYSVFANKSRN